MSQEQFIQSMSSLLYFKEVKKVIGWIILLWACCFHKRSHESKEIDKRKPETQDPNNSIVVTLPGSPVISYILSLGMKSPATQDLSIKFSCRR